MNKVIKGLLASLLACTSLVQAALQNGSTFIAHRDELANLGMEWTNSNHLQRKAKCKKVEETKRDKNAPAKKCVNPFGAEMSVTGFYSESTNDTDLAYRFGMGTTGAIKVTAGMPVVATTGVANSAALATTLYNVNIHQSPDSDGTSLAYAATGPDSRTDTAQDRVPMYGTLNFKPKRQVYGAYLGWNQSLDALLQGLEFTVRAPIAQVRNNMNPSTTGAHNSSIPAEDGKSGVGLLDYFGGKVSTDIATYPNVKQTALTKNIIDAQYATVTGLADLELGLNYAFQLPKLNKVHFNVGGLVQIPAGNKPDMIRLFEPIYGARGHVAAGAHGMMHLDAYEKGDMRIGFDLGANWKYFFKGTEVRGMGVYDITSKVMLPAGNYRLIMQNGVTGVQPAANVLALEHDVTPGHQVDAIAGFCVEYKNFTFDLGYNLFWHQREKVEQKGTWANDKFAYAHPHYSMNTVAPHDSELGSGVEYQYVSGGVAYLATDGGATNINHNGGFIGDHHGVGDSYDDTNSNVAKHAYKIGANGDAGGTPYILEYSYLDGIVDETNNYPSAFTSINGPIQKAGATTSALPVQTAAVYTNEADEVIATGVNRDDTGTLTVRYNVSSLPAVTDTQITHSIVGGVSYKVAGNYPMIIGVGGQGEFQESGRNSALEGFKVWAKFGISF